MKRAPRTRALPSVLGPWFLFALYHIFVFESLLRPTTELPVLPFSIDDKVAHFVEFCLLFWVSYYAFRLQFRRPANRVIVRSAWLWSVCAGALTEYLQTFVPDRRCDPWDLFADAIGAAAGAIVLRFVLIFFGQRQKKP